MLGEKEVELLRELLVTELPRVVRAGCGSSKSFGSDAGLVCEAGCGNSGFGSESALVCDFEDGPTVKNLEIEMETQNNSKHN